MVYKVQVYDRKSIRPTKNSYKVQVYDGENSHMTQIFITRRQLLEEVAVCWLVHIYQGNETNQA